MSEEKIREIFARNLNKYLEASNRQPADIVRDLNIPFSTVSNWVNGLKLPRMTLCVIALVINSGAYMAELIRSGINAVDKGQMEAARSLGMSKSQAMVKVVMPQAIKYILPAIGNECIALLKETSVAGYVAVVDVTKAATNIRNKTYDAVNPIILLALIYLVMVVALTRLLAIMERRLRKSDGK